MTITDLLFEVAEAIRRVDEPMPRLTVEPHRPQPPFDFESPPPPVPPCPTRPGAEPLPDRAIDAAEFTHPSRRPPIPPREPAEQAPPTPASGSDADRTPGPTSPGIRTAGTTLGPIRDAAHALAALSTSASPAVRRIPGVMGAIPVERLANGLDNLITGFRSHNVRLVISGGEEALTAATQATAEISGIAVASATTAAEFTSGGISLGISALGFIDGIIALKRKYNAHIVSKVLLAILVAHDPSAEDVPTTTSYVPGRVPSAMDLKRLYFRTMPPWLAATYWLLYKYKDKTKWILAAKECIHSIGIPILGIAAGILSLLYFSLSIASLGTAAIVITTVVGVASLGLLIMRGVEFGKSKKEFRDAIYPHLPPSIVAEIRHCISALHSVGGGPTSGDFFRYILAVFLYNAWVRGILTSPDTAAYMRAARSTSSIDILSFLCLSFDDAIALVVWLTVRSDIGDNEAKKLLDEAQHKYTEAFRGGTPSSSDAAQIRLQTIKLFFGKLRV